MAKAILEFDLPDDQDAFYYATKGIDFHIVVETIRNRLRNDYKYGNLSDELCDYIEKLRQEIIDEMIDRELGV